MIMRSVTSVYSWGLDYVPMLRNCAKAASRITYAGASYLADFLKIILALYKHNRQRLEECCVAQGLASRSLSGGHQIDKEAYSLCTVYKKGISLDFNKETIFWCFLLSC